MTPDLGGLESLLMLEARNLSVLPDLVPVLVVFLRIPEVVTGPRLDVLTTPLLLEP